MPGQNMLHAIAVGLAVLAAHGEAISMPIKSSSLVRRADPPVFPDTIAVSTISPRSEGTCYFRADLPDANAKTPPGMCCRRAISGNMAKQRDLADIVERLIIQYNPKCMTVEGGERVDQLKRSKDDFDLENAKNFTTICGAEVQCKKDFQGEDACCDILRRGDGGLPGIYELASAPDHVPQNPDQTPQPAPKPN